MVMLFKMILRVRLYHYGFVLALPGTMVLVATMVDWFPGEIGRRKGDVWITRAPLLAALLVTVLHFVGLTMEMVAMASSASGNGPDRFYTPSVDGYYNALLDTVRHRVTPEQTLAVVPEGVIVNYLTRRHNPTGHINFMPPELVLFGEQAIIDAFRKSPPDYVLWFSRSVAEYGKRAFGDDYAVRLGAYLLGAYHPVTTGASAGSPAFFGRYLLMRRNDAQGVRDEPVAPSIPSPAEPRTGTEAEK
jgi:hypothetical protein